jgi:hypothetical protein
MLLISLLLSKERLGAAVCVMAFLDISLGKG